VDDLDEIDFYSVDLDIVLRRDFGSQYNATAAATARHTEVAFGSDAVELDFDLYEILSLRQTSKVTRAVSRESVRSTQYVGRRLFESLFGGKLGSIYEEVQTWSSKLGRAFRLRLRMPDDDPVVRLPWELLYEADSVRRRGDFLALGGETSIIRQIDTPFPALPPQVEGPLRVLLVAYNDDELRFNLKPEIEGIIREFGSNVRILEGEAATVWSLSEALASYRPHIVHYAGTGVGEDDRSQAIVMRGAGGDRTSLSARHLEDLVLRVSDLRFVFLNAGNTDWIAAMLSRSVPAVLGMLGEYADKSAIALTRRVYRDLATGVELERALAAARRELNYSNPGSFDWSAPVLYLHGRGSLLARPEPRLKPPTLEPAPPAAVEAIVNQSGRDAEHQYLTARLEVARRNFAVVEAQARQLGEPLPAAVQAQLDQLRQLVADAEIALGMDRNERRSSE
jgi:CHAT domain-containing protein